MKMNELAVRLGFRDLTPELADTDVDILEGYTSDLLSDVLAHAPADGVLVTIQVHMNVVAVAVHAELAAVVFAHGRTPEEDVRLKAVEEGVPLFVAEECAFEVTGRLYQLGVRGPRS
ncbi:MAG TPA: serine kinase [Candidatus Hydrogenedentes bacterium]|nr:serine kinase [Candidatus Hydrogenedentota bacterium]